MMLSLDFFPEIWPLHNPFRISGFTIEALEVVRVVVSGNGYSGQGEGVIPIVFDVTMEQTTALLAEARAALQGGADARAHCAAMPVGPARNAFDCALWDHQSKSTSASVWDVAGLAPRPDSIEVVQTIGLGSAEEMAEAAGSSRHRILKLKMDAELILERVRAVRQARSDAELLLDANQAWSIDTLQDHSTALSALGVVMIEQPLPAAADGALRGFRSPIPVFADESCHTRKDMPRLMGLYQGINIKLDKTGGLTEALALQAEADRAGLGVMVGCMAGTSLSMAAAYVIASRARWSDLDGPLLLSGDREAAMEYRNGALHAPAPALWG